MASLGLNSDEQKAVERFRKAVVEPSMSSLVIVDFWAEWCGPCKALSPVLDKVAADYADKGVILAKINVDEDQFIAAQFQVRSIPTVYAIFEGRPVADLTSARSESQVKALLDKLLAQLPITGGEPVHDIAPFLVMGEEALEQGDGARAAGVFAQIVDMAPDNAPAHAGLIRALLLAGQTAEAQAALEALAPSLAADPIMERARAALALASEAPADGELETLRGAATSAGASMEARFTYATAAFAAGKREDAVEALLAMVAEDRTWNEGAARSRLLQIFEAVGLEDPWVAAQRRHLSTILFG